jgi:ADP-heptose:LPS heptosyltransferase
MGLLPRRSPEWPPLSASPDIARALPHPPRNILVGLLLPIGDTLLTTPALAALHRHFPEAPITALVSASNAGILEGNPDIARIVRVSLGDGGTAERFLAGMRALRNERYDLVINLSAASAIITRLGARAGARILLEMSPFWWLLGGSQDYRETHAVDHYLRTVAHLGVPMPSAEERVPRLYFSDHDRSEARRLLRERGVRAGDVRVALHVGGDGFNGRKRWAPSRFAAVANGLVERCEAQILLIGGKVDRGLSEKTAALIPRGAHVLAGATGLKATAALIESSSLFIGNDSAPLHIAAAIGTPAVGLFGPSDWNEFTPVGRPGYRQHVVHSDLPCSPCFRFVGNDPIWLPNPCYTFACLKQIGSGRVLSAALELLREQAGEPADGRERANSRGEDEITAPGSRHLD